MCSGPFDSKVESTLRYAALGPTFALLLLAVDAFALRVLTPAPSVATTNQTLRIVGYSDADAVRIEIDDTFFGSFPVEKGVFHAPIELRFGLAHVHVTDDIVDSEPIELEVLVSPRIQRAYEGVFTMHTFHGGDATEECLACHDLSKSELTSKACASCHPIVAMSFTDHADAETADCVACHPVRDDLKIIPPKSFGDHNPCYRCHADKIGEFAQEFVHGPVAGGSCTICHDPHGSSFEKTLHSPAVILCLSCHTNIDTSAPGVKHAPFENGQCVECHDPHATANKWVLVRTSEELCFKCHGEGDEIIGHPHPYNVKPRRPLAKNLHLTQRGRLECVSCHEPHVSKTRHLLRTGSENLCAGCHPSHE